MNFKFHRLKYDLQEAFGISRMVRNQVDALIIEIEYDGVSGFGEATDNPYYKSEIASLIEEFKNIREDLYISGNEEPIHFFQKQLSHLNIHHFLRCAIDEAYWDWYGKRKKCPSFHWLPWKWDSTSIPTSSYTIGLDHSEKMKEKILNNPWPIYKIKINNEDPVRLIEELRKVTNSPFYLDANASLDPIQFGKLLAQHEHLNIQLIEQPFKVGEEDRLLEFDRQIPIAGDESFIESEDLKRCRVYYDVCNFKLMKSGGISPVLNQVQQAKELGYRLMMGCMTESSIGISALAQFAPVLDYVDMDGALLLQKDLSEDIVFKNGVCQELKHYGNGIEVNLEKLEDLKYED